MASFGKFIVSLFVVFTCCFSRSVFLFVRVLAGEFFPFAVCLVIWLEGIDEKGIGYINLICLVTCLLIGRFLSGECVLC